MSGVIRVAIGVLTKICTDNVRVLIARRRDNGVLGGYWEFPGGKIEDGESLENCLVREFEEELGVVVKPGRGLPAIVHTYPHGTVELNPFYCELESGEPQDLEVAEHKWVTADELRGYDFPEANLDLLEEVIEALQSWDVQGV
ncbi:(deoxy)nucleoside triphosphate pyrophosphohydrolase [Poriferisphaera sp. WC338]|uniref:(deoxy)nucleoside triphosphate pyrophosphohydrolase n=1 Tax=Poriferisphaera sp. WC338 TaxID=3425129 RepID=UPI003D81A301